MSLAEYLDRATRVRHDCCTFMSGWLMANGFPDPMSNRRSSYSSPREYLRLLKEEGGLLASCGRRFQGIGLRETSTPGAGDVAVVLAPVAVKKNEHVLKATGAICVSETMRAVVAWDLALAIAELQTIKAWTFNA